MASFTEGELKLREVGVAWLGSGRLWPQPSSLPNLFVAFFPLNQDLWKKVSSRSLGQCGEDLSLLRS